MLNSNNYNRFTVRKQMINIEYYYVLDSVGNQ